MKNFLTTFLIGLAICSQAQNLESMMNDLQKDSTQTKEYVKSTFKGTKLINGHSIESPAPGVLQFIIYHRFGNMKEVLYNFFGLDQASTRLGLDYGINKNLSIGYGRTAVNKAIDGYIKYKILRQTTDNSMPVSLAIVEGASINCVKDATYYTNNGLRRLNYLSQIILARKFSQGFSAQLMPTLVHNNLAENGNKNTVFSLGYGARAKISRRTSVNWEHFYLMPNQLTSNYRSTIALGFDIDTGGHIFQFHLTNASSLIEQQFITNTTGNVLKSEFRLGFNISRVFTINKKAASKS